MFEGLITVGRAELWIAFGLLSVCMFVLGVSVGQIVHMMRHPVGRHHHDGRTRRPAGILEIPVGVPGFEIDELIKRWHADKATAKHAAELRRHNSALDAVDRTLSGIRWPEEEQP